MGCPKPATADAAGSLSTTLSDFARVMASLLGGSVLAATLRETLPTRQCDVVSARELPTFDRTASAGPAVPGLGRGLLETPRGEAFFPEGHAAGFRHCAVGFRASGDGLVILGNSASAEGVFAPLLEQVLGDAWTPVAWHGWVPWNQRPRRVEPRAVPRPAATLAALAGAYRLPLDVTVVIRVAGDHLTMQENAEPAQDLVAEDARDFRSASSSDRWTFECDSAGVGRTLVLHLPGRDLRLPRAD